MSGLIQFYRHYFFVLVPSLLVIAYVYVTDPIITRNGQLQSGMHEKQQMLSWMQESALRLPGGAGNSGSQANLNKPEAFIDHAKQLAVRFRVQANLNSIQPAGNGAIRMQFEAVQVSRFFGMLDALLQGSSMEVASLNMKRDEKSGHAMVELTLTSGKG